MDLNYNFTITGVVLRLFYVRFFLFFESTILDTEIVCGHGSIVVLRLDKSPKHRSTLSRHRDAPNFYKYFSFHSMVFLSPIPRLPPCNFLSSLYHFPFGSSCNLLGSFGPYLLHLHK